MIILWHTVVVVIAVDNATKGELCEHWTLSNMPIFFQMENSVLNKSPSLLKPTVIACWQRWIKYVCLYMWMLAQYLIPTLLTPMPFGVKRKFIVHYFPWPWNTQDVTFNSNLSIEFGSGSCSVQPSTVYLFTQTGIFAFAHLHFDVLR